MQQHGRPDFPGNAGRGGGHLPRRNYQDDALPQDYEPSISSSAHLSAADGSLIVVEVKLRVVCTGHAAN